MPLIKRISSSHALKERKRALAETYADLILDSISHLRFARSIGRRGQKGPKSLEFKDLIDLDRLEPARRVQSELPSRNLVTTISTGLSVGSRGRL